VMIGLLILAVILLRPGGILGEERVVSKLSETQPRDASPET
jgi:ABC-type branched-subunit amino acid transport system permease subunit